MTTPKRDSTLPPGGPSTLRCGAAATVLAMAILAGCSSVPPKRSADADPGAGVQRTRDPFESFNRKMFAFNDSLDRHVLEPVARGYANVVPSPVRTGVSNFFGNFADVWSAVNNLLQLKVADGLSDVMRVGTNTLFGVVGIFDVATPLGMQKHREDFGQTLGHYGVGSGPYLVLPLFGPSTVRDTAVFPIDRYVSPALFTDDWGVKAGIYTVQLVNTRAQLLGATQLINDVALDKYSFVRDAYLQRRQSLVDDGKGKDDQEAPDPRRQ